MNISLQGKTALVTGATGELGRAIAMGLAESGANVVLHYLNARDKAEVLRRRIKDRCGVDAATVGGDLTSEAFVGELAARYGQGTASIDLLVANAVVQFTWRTVLEQPAEDYVKQFEICALQCVRLAKAFAPAMIARKWGRIVAINTECSMQCAEGTSAYVAGKRALDGVVRVLAREIGEHGITVNQVAPGWILSEKHPDKDLPLYHEYKRRTPLRRRGSPEDIANAVTFLCSEQARFITGCYLPVCGGNVMPAI